MKIAILGAATLLLSSTAAFAANEPPAAAPDSASCSTSLIQAIEAAKTATTTPQNKYSGKGGGGFANALKAYAVAEKAVKGGCDYFAKHPAAKAGKAPAPLKAEKNAKDDDCSTAIVADINKAMEAIHESPANGHAGGKFATAQNQLSRARAQVRRGCVVALKPAKGSKTPAKDKTDEAKAPAHQ